MTCRPHAALDIGIGDLEDHARRVEAFERGRQFCRTKADMYGVPNDVALLDSTQREMLAEAAESDPFWSSRGTISFEDPGNFTCGRLLIELFTDIVPKTASNFACLCTGEKGLGKSSKKPLHFKGCRFHRVEAGFCCQAGDIVKGDGSAGDSIYGGRFSDEKAGLKLQHDRAGVVSMANVGKNSNSSQFFITFGPAPHCNGKHVVFGQLVKGHDVLRRIEAQAASKGGAPRVAVTIVDCGLVSD